MNSVNLTGRLGRDPELKTTNSGKSVTSISIAVQDGKDRTYWLPIVAWEKTADFICRYFRKGDGIEITGKVTERKYEDRDGNKRSVVEVVAMNVGFPQGKSSTENGAEIGYSASNVTHGNFSGSGRNAAYSAAADVSVDDGDLPF